MWKPFFSYAEQARHVLINNKYMVIATCGKDGKPWAATVFYAYDALYNLYFVSAIDSQHIKNILENSNVAIDIFDSRQPLGYSMQVQISGKVTEVNKKDLKRLVELYHERLFKKSGITSTGRYDVDEYVNPSEFRIFKVTLGKVYTTGSDRRVEVDLKD